MPAYEHNQWTFEGEIERLGEFSRGAARATGWKRAVALIVAVALLAPVVITLLSLIGNPFNGRGQRCLSESRPSACACA